jgi:hypothetical protein
MGVFVYVGILLLVLLLLHLSSAESSSSSTDSTSDIQRIGDATVNAMRRTSESFREHIDKETR